MRKLILTVTLAILSTGVYAQDKATTGTAPSKTLTCNADDPQNPIVGKKYTYSVEGQEGKYHFFATSNGNFIENGNLKNDNAYTETAGQINVSAGDYNNSNSTQKSIEITWTSAAAPTSFLVVNHTSNTVCTTTNNLKVLKIQPKNAFFIELRNMNEGNTQNLSDVSNVNVCLGAIKSAEVQGDNITYNYGEQSLFYELIAVNYDKTFLPKIKVQGLQAGQTATLKWGYSKDAINTTLQTINHTQTDVELTLPKITALETVAPSQGVSIFLELIVHNGKVEGSATQDITLLADATTGKDDNINNVKTDCTEEGPFADKAIQTLQVRPGVTAQNGLNFMLAQP
ncbi:MAG: hypothetical protein Q4A09_06600 [Capnocytophaga felis]|nr:hypothetical protein [Capnocytophaga felis]